MQSEESFCIDYDLVTQTGSETLIKKKKNIGSKTTIVIVIANCEGESGGEARKDLRGEGRILCSCFCVWLIEE